MKKITIPIVLLGSILLSGMQLVYAQNGVFTSENFESPDEFTIVGNVNQDFTVQVTTEALDSLEQIEIYAFAQEDPANPGNPGDTLLITTLNAPFAQEDITFQINGNDIIGAAGEAVDSLYTLRAVGIVDEDGLGTLIENGEAYLDVYADVDPPIVVFENIDGNALTDTVEAAPEPSTNTLAFSVDDELIDLQAYDIYDLELTIEGDVFTGTAQEFIDDGFLSISGNILTFELNLYSYEGTNANISLEVTDGGNNSAIVNETVEVFDTINNGDSERATILELPYDELSGNETISLTAEARLDVHGVLFEVQYTSHDGFTQTPFVKLDSLVTPAFYNTVQVNSADLHNALDVLEIDGTLTFRAVGFDNAGVAFYFDQNGVTAPYNTGNMDDPTQVATISLDYDDVAPYGELTVDGLPVVDPTSPINTETWANQDYSDFNNWNELIPLSFDVLATDFSHGYFTLLRKASREPGVAATFRSSEEQIIGTLNDPSDIYELDPSTLDDGAVYELRLYIVDELGNQSEQERIDFTTVGPRAHITGMSDEHGEIFITATPHTQSAHLEVSTDDGTSFQSLQVLDSFSQTTQAGYDAYKTTRFNLESEELPLGDLLFRVTASENSKANFFEANHAINPTTLQVAHETSELVRSKAAKATQQQIFTPLTTEDINLTLYKAKGKLDDIRVEVSPINNDDNLNLFFVADQNLFSTLNDLEYAYYPRYAYGSSTDNFGVGNALESIDGKFLGFLGDMETINLENNIDISSGGSFYAYATTVLPSGETVMTRKNLTVNRIAAANGGTISSENDNFTLDVAANTLDVNASLMIEEDPGNLYMTHSSNNEYGQVGSGYFLRSFQTDPIRNGYRANLTLSFDDSDIIDINGDGSIDDEKAQLMVGYTLEDETEISFSGIRNKAVDGTNNTVSFELSQLPDEAHRYVLVLKDAVVNRPGSITTISKSIDENQPYVNINSRAAIVVSDQISKLDTANVYVIIDNNVSVERTITTKSGIEKGWQISADETFKSLNLTEGLHTIRFIIPNNNGDRVDVSYDIIIDQKAPSLSSVTEIVESIESGEKNRLHFRVIDPAAGDTSGGGVNTDSLFVDVYLTENVATTDSSGNTTTNVERKFFKQYGPGEIVVTDNSRGDSLSAYFDVVFNRARDVTGYEYVVHDGKVDLSSDTILFSIQNYIGNGIPDKSGNKSRISSFTIGIGDVPSSNELAGEVPEKYNLEQNYPNPFNPSTTIQYGIPEAGKVQIKVFNILGKEVATLVNERKSAGTYQVRFDASHLSSGLYLYRIVSNNFVQTKKLMLIK